MASIARGRRGDIIEDENLIRQISQGDVHAFRQFVEQHSQHVYKVTYSVLRDTKEAEDAAQETFYKSINLSPTTVIRD